MASTLVFANNAGSTLAGSISNTSVSLNLQAGGGALFPNPSGSQYFVITAIDAATGLLREIMWCTARSADTLTVVRGQEGTTALNWNAGDLIQELWTAGQAATMLQTGQAGTTFVPVVPATVWYVDGGLGSDVAGQGLTPGTGAFASPQFAVNTIGKYFSASQVTINIAAWASQYNGFSISQSLISSWNIIGSGTSTCTISANTFATNGGFAISSSQSVVNVTGMTLRAISVCLYAQTSSSMTYTNIALVGGGTSAIGIFSNLGATTNNNNGATVTYSGTYSSVLSAQAGGLNEIGFTGGAGNRTITMTNSSATVTNGFAVTSQSGTVLFFPSSVTFAGGNPTGPKFNSANTGFINTAGSGTSYLPGTVAGTAQNTFNYA